MIELMAMAFLILVSCLIASMYGYPSLFEDAERRARLEERELKREAKREAIYLVPVRRTLANSDASKEKTEPSQLEKIAIEDLPEQMSRAPKGLLAEFYVKKEVYVRRDLA